MANRLSGDAKNDIHLSLEATTEKAMSPELVDINHSNPRQLQNNTFQWLNGLTLTLPMGLLVIQEVVKHFPKTADDFSNAIAIYVIRGAKTKYPEEIRTAVNTVNPRDWCRCNCCDFMLYLEECFCCRFDKGPGLCEGQSLEVQRIINDKYAEYREYSWERRTHEVMRKARKATYTQITIEKFLPSLPPDDSRRNQEPESVVLPSCIKWAVRSRLPDPNERYVGHGARVSECENNFVVGSPMTPGQNQEDFAIPHVQSDTDIDMSESSASSAKLSTCSTPAESDEDNISDCIEMAIRHIDKQKLLDCEWQKEVENLSLKKLIQVVEILNNQNFELALKLPRHIWDVIKTVGKKYPELEPLLKEICLLPCICGKCCRGPLCKPDERECCKQENCVTNREEFTLMVEEVKQEYHRNLASAPTQKGELLEQARKLIYNRTADLSVIKGSASEAAIRTVAPNCVKCAARTTFPDPNNEYNGMRAKDRE